MRNRRVLLTGATGFVGTRLLPVLEAQGFEVIGATRHPEQAARNHPERKFVLLDANDPGTLRSALEGCAGVVYLIHAMASGGDYVEQERRGALSFRAAAEAAGVERIVYLGGMQPSGTASPHLASRLRTGAILRSGSVSTIELQATMVIGSGSESFRMVRDLAARLPLMVLPAWADTLTQPVAIADVVAAIAHALAQTGSDSCAYPLPGPETLSARDILLRTAKLLGRRPFMIGVPFVTPKLSSYWIRLITRADYHIAEQLVEGLRSDILCDGPGYWARFPEHRLLSFDAAAKSALAEEEKGLGRRARVMEHLIEQVSPKEQHGRP